MVDGSARRQGGHRDRRRTGLGRSHALLLAAEGAAVIVNDLGGEWDGHGADRAASETAADLVAAGGRASPTSTTWPTGAASG